MVAGQVKHWVDEPMQLVQGAVQAAQELVEKNLPVGQRQTPSATARPAMGEQAVQAVKDVQVVQPALQARHRLPASNLPAGQAQELVAGVKV